MGECREADRRGNTFASSPRQILFVATAALALAMSFLLGVSPTSAGAESLPDGPGTITVDEKDIVPFKKKLAYGSTGANGFQDHNAIAVRNPDVSWDGTKAIFSMVIVSSPDSS